MAKDNFTRDEVVKILDWLLGSRYHKEGFNGWNKYGHSDYLGFRSETVLEDAEKELKLIDKRKDNG